MSHKQTTKQRTIYHRVTSVEDIILCEETSTTRIPLHTQRHAFASIYMFESLKTVQFCCTKNSDRHLFVRVLSVQITKYHGVTLIKISTVPHIFNSFSCEKFSSFKYKKRLSKLKFSIFFLTV